MIDRKDRMPAGFEHPVKLPENRFPLLEVIHAKGADHQVRPAVFQDVRRHFEIGIQDFRLIAQPLPRQPDHLVIGIDGDHLCPSLCQPLGVHAWPAASIQGAQAANSGQQRERRGALEIGVVRLGVHLGGISCWRKMEIIHEYASLQLDPPQRAKLESLRAQHFLGRLKSTETEPDGTIRENLFHLNINNL